MNQIQMIEDAKSNEKSIIKELREEIGVLKKWKETAIIETVDKDRSLSFDCISPLRFRPLVLVPNHH
jgi:hypothetical protein